MALETKPIDIKWPLPPLFLYLSRFRAKEEGWADYVSIREEEEGLEGLAKLESQKRKGLQRPSQCFQTPGRNIPRVRFVS